MASAALAPPLCACAPAVEGPATGRDLGGTAGRFTHGVASGDPHADSVVLWTRFVPAGDSQAASEAALVQVELSMSVDRERLALGELTDVSGLYEAQPDRDHTVHIVADGLQPDTTYYYQFRVGEQRSAIGRTRTLPAATVESDLHLAVVSCAYYPSGYYNVYRSLATRPDLQAVLHLGDYIYEYGHQNTGFGPRGTLAGRLRAGEHEAETLTLGDYRARYALYRSDPNLQECHRQHPFIPLWDDHEVMNNAYAAGAVGVDDADYRWRKLAAQRAFFEWLPVRESVPYRSFRLGKLAQLTVLDSRLTGRAKQAETIDEAGKPGRQMLGLQQERWLRETLAASDAPWQLIGQQVLVSELRLFPGPASLATALGPAKEVTKKGLMDIWSGYPWARERLLSMLPTASAGNEAQPNVIFLTGDIHSSWAGKVQRSAANRGKKETLALELVTPAISSPPLRATLRTKTPLPPDLLDRYLGYLPSLNPHFDYHELDHNGFLLLTVRPEALSAEWWHVDPRDEDHVPVFATGRRVHAGERAFTRFAQGSHPEPESPPLSPSGARAPAMAATRGRG